MTEPQESPRDGLPWMPEETLFCLVGDEFCGEDGHLHPNVIEAFEAVKELREAAVNVVAAYASHKEGCPVLAGAMYELEEALLLGITEDESGESE